MRNVFHPYAASLLCSISLFSLALPVYAQDATDASTQEAVDMYVGDIFEVMPVHDLQNPTYTWILTQDRTFIEAIRAPVFRKRLITPGVYTLYAEVSSGDSTTHISRTFTLNYKPRLPGQEFPATGSGAHATELVTTVPSQIANGRAIVPMSSQLLKLEPINPDVRPLAADVNLSLDSDGDGNPENDLDTESTFFQSDATPMYLWFAQPFERHTISITAARPEGALVQRLEILAETYAEQQGLIQSTVSMIMEQTKDRTYSFTAQFDTPSQPDTSMIYSWEFGDGQESLLANPQHTYAADGDYTVRLRIRNLSDGHDVANISQELTVASASEPIPNDTEVPANNNGRSLASLGSILLLVGIFAGFILVGAVIIVVLSRLRRRGRSLSDTIEAMENTMVKKGDTAKAPPPLAINPPVATIKPTTPPPSIAKREMEQASTNPVLDKPLKVEEKNAPAWLKSGLAGQAVPPPAAPTPPAPKPTQTPAASVASGSGARQAIAPFTLTTPKPPVAAAPTLIASQSPVAQTTPASQQTSVRPAPPTPTPNPTPPRPQPSATPRPQATMPVNPPPVTTPSVQPKPQSPPTPQPTPARPAPPTPTPTPTPIQPRQQQTVPPWLQQTPTSTSPAPTQTQTPPTPAPTPIQAPTPPSPSTPVPNPNPSPNPSSVTPTPTPTPTPSSDQPIAFIRADSLNSKPPTAQQ